MPAGSTEDFFSRSLANQLLLLPEGIVFVVHGRRLRGGGVRAILAELIRLSCVPQGIWDEVSIASQSTEKLLEWVTLRDEVPEPPGR